MLPKFLTLLNSYFNIRWGFPGGSDSKEYACNAGDLVLSLGQEDPLEKGMATRSSILAWRIPWTKASGRLQSMGHNELDTTDRLTLTFTLV